MSQPSRGLNMSSPRRRQRYPPPTFVIQTSYRFRGFPEPDVLGILIIQSGLSKKVCYWYIVFCFCHLKLHTELWIQKLNWKLPIRYSESCSGIIRDPIQNTAVTFLLVRNFFSPVYEENLVMAICQNSSQAREDQKRHWMRGFSCWEMC